MVNEFRFSWSRADVRRRAAGVRPAAAGAARRSPACPTIPLVAGGVPGHHDRRLLRRPGLGRIGSPDFLPKFQHTNQFEFTRHALLAARQPRSSSSAPTCIAPMKNEYLDVPGDARRAALPQRASPGNAGWPTSCSATCSDVAALERRTSSTSATGRRSFFVQDDWKVTAEADAEPRPALRLHHAGARGRRTARPTSTRRARAAWSSPTDGSLEDRGLVKPDTNNFAPRIGVVYKLNDKTVLRGGYGIFYNLFDRVGSEDQLALNLPGPDQQQPGDAAAGTPLFLLQDGFPADFLDPQPRSGRGPAPRSACAPAGRTRRRRRSTRPASAAQKRDRAASSLSCDVVCTEGRNLASLVNLNQPLPSGRRGAPALSRTSASSSGASRTAISSTRASTSASSAASRRATASASPTRSATPRTTASEHLTTQGSPSLPAELARPRGLVRPERLRRPAPPGRRTSSSSCRSAKGSRWR